MRVDYTVDEIIAMSKEEMWQLPVGGLRVTFSDKTIVCPTNIIKVNWYFWQLYKFGQLTGVSTDYYMGNINFNGSVPRKELSKIFWDVFLRKVGGFFPGQGLDLVWDMSRRTYQIINELYNDTIFKMTGHVSTLDIMDLVAIVDNPEVIEARNEWKAGAIDTDQCHDVTWGVLTSGDPALKYNELSRGARTEIFNRRQTNQNIGPRANIPEINGEAHPSSIEHGYIEGLSSQYDRTIEACTASIAYFMAKAPLEDSEYNNRMAQFLCSVIRGVEHKDCGTKRTINFRVKDKKDLRRIRGKFRVCEGGHNHMIHGTEEELIGQVVKLRSFTQCETENPQYPCAMCVGWNAWTTPPNTVLGHHLSTEPLARISQTILSTKHVIASTKPLFLSINLENAKYMELAMDNPHEVLLRKQKEAESVRLRFSRDDALFLNDILDIDSVDEVLESRISAVNVIQMQYTYPNKNNPVAVNLEIGLGGFGSPLSRELLAYMREVGWDIIGTNIEVDMNGWDWALPITRTPARGADIMSVLYTFQDFVNNPKKPGAVRSCDFNHPGPAIEALMDGLSKYIDVNYAHIEVFVRALMCKLDANGQNTYELPRAGEPFMFGSMKNIILNRSQGPGMGFESHLRTMFSSSTYLKDGLFIPSTEMDYIWSE